MGKNRGTHNRAIATVVALIAMVAAAPSASAESRGESRDHHRDRHRERHGRPAGGTCTTTFRFTGPTTIHIDGQCNLLHLGAATLSAEQTVTVNGDGSVSAVNESIYTASNGDQLFSNFVGRAVPSGAGLALSGIETYDGGTGRFDDATGRSTLEGSVQFTSPSSGVGLYRLDGQISF